VWWIVISEPIVFGREDALRGKEWKEMGIGDEGRKYGER